MMAAVSLTVAVYELMIWAHRRGNTAELAFVVTCLVIACYNMVVAGLYSVDSPAASIVWLRAQAVTLNLLALSFLWYIAGRTKLVPRPVLLAFCVIFILNAAIQIIGFGDLTWIGTEPIVRRVALPFGVTVVYHEVATGILTDLENVFGMILLAVAVAAVIRYYLAKRGRDAFSLMIVVIVLMLGFANDLAVAYGLYSFPYLVEYSWLAALLLMGVERSNQILDAVETAKALTESERQFKTIFESLQDVYYKTNGEGIIQMVSPSIRSLAGCESADVVGKPFMDFLMDPRDRIVIAGILETMKSVTDYELMIRRPDGKAMNASLNAHALFDGNGLPVGTEGTLRDIGDRIESQDRILRSLHEKEVLLKEVHHRVKNNLQIISSLLNLQGGRIVNPVDFSVIEDCKNQILSMALIHEDLYNAQDLARVEFGNYLNTLVSRMLASHRKVAMISFVPDLESVLLSIDTAIPCGLIVNELCTNVLKHAFPAGFSERPKEIHITLDRPNNGPVRLVVADTGVGFPPGFDIESGDSLGLKIVSTLVSQIDGTLRFERNEGSRFIIEFPA